MKSILALVAIVSPLVAGAQGGSTRVPVDDVRILLISAIDSPTSVCARSGSDRPSLVRCMLS